MDLAKVTRFLKACEQSYRDSSEEMDDRGSSCGYEFYELDAMATAFREARQGLERGEEWVLQKTLELEAESEEYAESRQECPECGHVIKDGYCLDPSCPYTEDENAISA